MPPKSSTTTFRFDSLFLEVLKRMAQVHGVTQAEIVRQSVAAAAGLFAEARRDALAGLAALRERYGDDGELLTSVSVGADGLPVGHLVIDGVEPDDVRPFPVVVEGAGYVHVFLDVERDEQSGPVLARIGSDTLLVRHVRLPLGELPWPPRKDLGIRIRFGDLAELLAEESMPDLQPVEV